MATLLSGNHMLKRTCYIIYNIYKHVQKLNITNRVVKFF